jgi:hypothetical protein
MRGKSHHAQKAPDVPFYKMKIIRKSATSTFVCIAAGNEGKYCCQSCKKNTSFFIIFYIDIVISED